LQSGQVHDGRFDVGRVTEFFEKFHEKFVAFFQPSVFQTRDKMKENFILDIKSSEQIKDVPHGRRPVVKAIVDQQV
jgi:hypothetical protein